MSRHWWKIALAVIVVAFLAALILPATQPAREPHGEAEWFRQKELRRAAHDRP